MIDYPRFVKGKLTEIISKMATEPKFFVKNPNADFTGKRRLSFETGMNLMLSMGGNSLTNELMEYFYYDVNMASSSAFIQQRATLRYINLYSRPLHLTILICT